eukprot:363852-Chlamydomonas_euryale.AAC.6
MKYMCTVCIPARSVPVPARPRRNSTSVRQQSTLYMRVVRDRRALMLSGRLACGSSEMPCWR